MATRHPGRGLLAADAGQQRPGATSAGPAAWPTYGVIAACMLLALVLRLYQLSRPGEVLGVTEYDDGVLFGNAVRLVNGVIPYRDFVVVEPPGSIVLMAPVALLAKVTGTAWGLGIARLLTAGADTACVILLGLLVRHRGPLAAGIACGIYAVYPDAAGTAHTFFLEPWLNLLCLVGATCVFNGDRVADGRRLGWGGVAFGFAVAVKLFALVPLAVVLLLLLARSPRRTVPLIAGAAAGLSIPVLPFLIMAPGRLITDAVTSQLFRYNGSHHVLPRLENLVGSSRYPKLPAQAYPLAPLAVAAAIVIGYAMARLIAGRIPTPLDWYALASLAGVTLMLAVPYSYASHYGAFDGPFIALALALPVGMLRPAEHETQLMAAVAAGAIAAVAIAGVGLRQFAAETHLNAWSSQARDIIVDRLIPAGACVITDGPSLTISADRFVSDTPGCPGIVDSFGTFLAVTDGQTNDAEPQLKREDAGLWLEAFEHAEYVWLRSRSEGRIEWTPALDDYFTSHFRLIGLAGHVPSQGDGPRGGLYIQRR